ncbi:GNAT family N-acetyltransferase [Arthrobacter sp. CJ23]|uniref:GNAT family N-acetyltransferase n=1 Tax=Arthrobacter sp. CJ23 TaxID=2972479 RepID=UPI00215BA8D1|nr:GNAT family N-acetyltransferase [Arthrobacter sp. CJ23]UVJ39236.1 GNAT family N-acetyltransferase [Arthrobacter sp. CJ23]
MPRIPEILAAYDAQLRASIPVEPPSGYDFQLHGPVLRVVGGHRGFIDAPRDLGLEGSAVDRLIAEQRDFFAARGEAVEWKTRSHDLPADLPERLLAAGFVPEEPETVMVGETALMTAEPEVPDGVRLRAVHERTDLERIAAMESAVWADELSWMADDLHSRISADPDNIEVLVAEAGGRVVSAAWLVFRPGKDFAGLWGGSTLSEWRGRGIYRALIARRAQLALARGVRYLQVDASKDSEPVLRRLGFEAITTTTPYVWSPVRG